MKNIEIQRHFKRVYELGCVITGNPNCVLHHASGGSIKELGIHKGKSQKTSDWLVIPLIPDLHNGNNGIHIIGVLTWEARFGSQVDHLNMICNLLGVNLWQKAGIDYCYQKVLL